MTGARDSRRRSPLFYAGAVLTVVLVAAGVVSVWLFLGAQHQAAEAEELSQRKRAQAEVVADFYVATLSWDAEAMLSSVSAAHEATVREYFGEREPLGVTMDREWVGDVLHMRTAGTWGDTIRYEFAANGDKRRAVVAVGMYVAVEGEDDAKLAGAEAAVEFEDGRWVVTALDGKTIDEMF